MLTYKLLTNRGGGPVDGVLVETGIGVTENVLVHNGNILAVDSKQNLYLPSFINNSVKQYLYKIPLVPSKISGDSFTGSVSFRKEITDLANTTHYSYWVSIVTSVLLDKQESSVFCTSCKNIRYVNSYYDSSLAYVCYNAEDGAELYNQAYSDSPKVGFLGTAHSAKMLNDGTTALLPLVLQCAGGTDADNSNIGFLTVDVTTGNILKIERSDLLWKLALGMAVVNSNAYIYLPGMLLSYHGDGTFQYASLGTAPANAVVTGSSGLLSKNIWSVLDSDDEYLYLSNINQIFKVRATDLAIVSSATVPFEIWCIRCNQDYLYVNSQQYLLVFSKELQLKFCSKFSGFTPHAFYIANNRITIWDSTNKDVFNLSLTSFFNIQDIHVGKYRILRKNPALFSIPIDNSVRNANPVSAPLYNGTILQDTSYTISDVQGNSVKYNIF